MEEPTARKHAHLDGQNKLTLMLSHITQVRNRNRIKRFEAPQSGCIDLLLGRQERKRRR